MKLVKARVRELDDHTESRWFDLNPQLNLFQFPDHQSGHRFLRILQTINPPYPIEKVKPFADLPAYIRQNGHTRRVHPAKRTAALTVFSATPGLVRELSNISDLLYETDRIEVGRRLDYSRWINFVELASSSRWSEISSEIESLAAKARGTSSDWSNPLSELFATLKPADRIKDQLKDQLKEWLDGLPAKLQENSMELLETTMKIVDRVDHFQVAREVVERRMPLFVLVGSNRSTGRQIGEQRNSSSFSNLLQLISDRASVLGQQSKSDQRIFLQELNNQLLALQPSTMKMRLKQSDTGELLLFNDEPAAEPAEGPLFRLRQMQAKTCMAVAFSRIVYKTEAILLFDEPENDVSPALHEDLIDFITSISKNSQCLYCFSGKTIFPQDAIGRQYSAAELEMTAS